MQTVPNSIFCDWSFLNCYFPLSVQTQNMDGRYYSYPQVTQVEMTNYIWNVVIICNEGPQCDWRFSVWGKVSCIWDSCRSLGPASPGHVAHVLWEPRCRRDLGIQNLKKSKRPYFTNKRAFITRNKMMEHSSHGTIELVTNYASFWT